MGGSLGEKGIKVSHWMRGSCTCCIMCAETALVRTFWQRRLAGPLLEVPVRERSVHVLRRPKRGVLRELLDSHAEITRVDLARVLYRYGRRTDADVQSTHRCDPRRTRQRYGNERAGMKDTNVSVVACRVATDSRNDKSIIPSSSYASRHIIVFVRSHDAP